MEFRFETPLNLSIESGSPDNIDSLPMNTEFLFKFSLISFNFILSSQRPYTYFIRLRTQWSFWCANGNRNTFVLVSVLSTTSGHPAKGNFR